MSSSSSLVSSSRRIGEEEEDNGNPPPTSMLLGFQHLEERIIIATTTTQLHVPSIIDIVGCDITIKDIQSAKQELIKQKIDLKMDVNEWQKILPFFGAVTPMIYFCETGNLLIIKLLFLIGADCAKLCGNNYWFPMLVAAKQGHFDICKWLFEYGGDAKYQINKETIGWHTALSESYIAWRYYGRVKEGKVCRWLLLNGGGQRLSSEAMGCLQIDGIEEAKSNLLVLWTRENIQLHDTFMLLLYGAATIMSTTTSSSSEQPSDGGTREHDRKRKRHPERPLQILNGHPGIMELIGEYVGVIRGKELRMLQQFNELVINSTTDEVESSDEDNSSEDEE